MFHGWKISLLVSLGNLLLQGAGVYLVNAFIEPLCDLHGWTRTDVAASVAVGSLASIVSVAFLGSLGGRVRLRVLMTAGALLAAGGWAGMGMTSSWPVFTGLLALTWVCGQICGGALGSALVCNWFAACRGRAMGLATLGTSVSGMTLPFLAMLLIERFDVRTAYLCMGGVVFLLAPLCWLVVRDHPHELGLTRDGLPETAGAAPPARAASLSRLVRDPVFLLTGLAMGSGLMAAAGVTSQLKPHFSAIGLNAHTAMCLMCLCAFCAGASKFFWGVCCDRAGAVRASRLLLLANIAGLLPAFLPGTFATSLLFSVGYGLAYGGLWTLFPAIFAHLYGARSFLAVYRYAYLFVLMQTVGYAVMGASFDAFGSYRPAYLFFLVMQAVTFAGFLLVRPAPAAPPAEDHADGGRS